MSCSSVYLVAPKCNVNLGELPKLFNVSSNELIAIFILSINANLFFTVFEIAFILSSLGIKATFKIKLLLDGFKKSKILAILFTRLDNMKSSLVGFKKLSTFPIKSVTPCKNVTGLSKFKIL